MRVRNEKGITLVVLAVTIVVLLILTGVGVTIGISQVNNIRLKAFYTKLEIATEAVEKIADTNEYDKDWGTALTAEQISLITSISASYNTSNFRYFTAEEVESLLNVSGVDLNLLIDFKDRKVISADGEEIDGTTYYILEDTKNRAKYDPSKNVTNIDFDDFVVSNYGSSSYKIKVTLINVGNIKNGTLKYRKSNVDDYWKVVSGNEIIVSDLGNYDINYTDNNGNSVQKTIKIEKNGEDEISWTLLS